MTALATIEALCAATFRARGSQPEACGAKVPGGDGLCCQPAGHAGRHDTGSASWPRLPCDDMQPERIAPACGDCGWCRFKAAIAAARSVV